MKFGILYNIRIFVVLSTNDILKYMLIQRYCLYCFDCYYLQRYRAAQIPCLPLICKFSVFLVEQTEGEQPFFIIQISKTMTKNLKFANNAQGADNARTSPRKREIPALSLKRQLKHLKAMIRTERNNKLRAYSFILDNCIFDCYSHYCMTTLPDSIPDEFIEIMDIMSLKTDPTLLKNDALWKS